MYISSWLKAARLPSQSYIFLPLLLGQSLAMASGTPFNLTRFGLIQLFGLTIQLYIVFANDFADQETDKHNRTFTPFSGGSRVLVDGNLQPDTLKKAALVMATASILIGGILSLLSANFWPAVLSCAGVLLLWLYSYPPVKLSYRGGGELLQMIGVGMVLPCFGFVALHEDLSVFPWELLGIILPTQLACAIGTAAPDAPSDAMDQKRTLPTLLGLLYSRILLIGLHFVTVALLLLAPFGSYQFHVSFFCKILISGSILGQIMMIKSFPGSKGMLLFTFFSILTTLLGMVILTAVFWP